jgi:hypothetical protein
MLATGLLLAGAPPLHGEPFIDLYGGWSKAKSTAVSATQQTCFLVGCTAPAQTIQSVAFQSGPSVGLRGGVWLERLSWLGVAGDLSYFATASQALQLDSLALSVTPMARLPLFTTQDRPHGLLQPYVGAGPTLVVHGVTADFRPASPIALSGWSVAVGWTARAGLAVPVSERIAFFGEWRLSQDRVSLQQHGWFGIGDQGRLDLTQTTQHLLFGLSYRF